MMSPQLVVNCMRSKHNAAQITQSYIVWGQLSFTFPDILDKPDRKLPVICIKFLFQFAFFKIGEYLQHTFDYWTVSSLGQAKKYPY